MNKKHKKTLEAIYASPVRRNIAFRDIETLLAAVGCVVDNRDGSCVQFSKDGKRWSTHRPHPQKEARKYHVTGVREFLAQLGVEP